MSASDFDLELQELHRRSIGRLLAADVFNREAFTELKIFLCKKSEAIKAEHVISKQVLSCLLDAIGLINSRAEYLPDVRESAAMAADFHMLLGLVAIGEAWDDRSPGVPRVV